MAEKKYTEDEEIFVREQIRMISNEMNKIYDDILKDIAKLDTKDAIEVMKKLSEGQKRHDKKLK